MFRYGLTTDDRSLVDLAVLPRGAFVLGGGYQLEVVNVHDPNPFYAGNKFIYAETPRAPSTDRLFTVRRVQGSLVEFDGGQFYFKDRGLLVNLGSDTGSSTPNWNGSSVAVYETPSTVGPTYPNAIVPAARARTEGFYGDGSPVWLVGRTKSQRPLFVTPDLGAVEVSTAVPPPPVPPGPPGLPFTYGPTAPTPDPGTPHIWFKTGPPDEVWVWLRGSDGIDRWIFWGSAT